MPVLPRAAADGGVRQVHGDDVYGEQVLSALRGGGDADCDGGGVGQILSAMSCEASADRGGQHAAGRVHALRRVVDRRYEL